MNYYLGTIKQLGIYINDINIYNTNFNNIGIGKSNDILDLLIKVNQDDAIEAIKLLTDNKMEENDIFLWFKD